jgi:5,5'-dehydrodivanillate O-demethylase
MNQDFVAWVGQGAIADRTQEHLGESDRGVIMIRKRLLDDIEAVAAGRDPMATIRDPGANQRVHLPNIVGRVNRPPAAGGPPRFPFLAGQPADVRAEFEKAWQDCAAAQTRTAASG